MLGDSCILTAGQGNFGTCEDVSWCNSKNGTIETGFCPQDPSDVSCCFRPNCNNIAINGWCDLTNVTCTLGGYVRYEYTAQEGSNVQFRAFLTQSLVVTALDHQAMR